MVVGTRSELLGLAACLHAGLAEDAHIARFTVWTPSMKERQEVDQSVE